MDKFFKAIFNRNTIFPWILVLLSAFLSLKSWVSGTWLSGWDTLHPEFNFSLSFERLLDGVFRPEQGLGAVAAHAHMSDLPRVILLFLASIILPDQILRYVFISVCLIVGVLGTYFFIKKTVFKDSVYSRAFAFLGALFYLLNLGTLQHFYVPFEMFTVSFALLPWLFLLATKYLLQPVRKNLILFALITLFATPMAFASVLWFASVLALVLYLVILGKRHLKRVLILVVISLAINSFWLLPNMYFIFSGNASLVSEAKSNKIFSQEAFSYNRSYGRIEDVLIFKNFLFDWASFDGLDNFEYLFGDTRNQIASPQTKTLGYILTTVAVLGLVFGVLNRNKVAIALILPSIFAAAFLINQNPPLDGLFSLLREKVPLFSESLRFSFTKFSIILMFSFSCFFALGQKAIYDVVNKIGFKKLAFGFLVVQLTISAAVFYTYMQFVFEKGYISRKIQVKIPEDYFEMFAWFDGQPKEGKIANLPVHNLFGWVYYSWGFQGAQFISFGIKQPLLDRDFDRWNPQNEQYYKEMSYAIYSQNAELLSKVIQKYNIKYFILDKNVINPGLQQDHKALFFDQSESLLGSMENIRKARVFGKISLFEVVSTKTDLVSSPREFIQVSGGDAPFDIDFVYKDFGTHINSKVSDIPTVDYPNKSFIDNQNIMPAPLNLSKSGLFLEKYTETESSIPVSVYLKQEGDNLLVKLVYKITGQEKNISLAQKPSKWLINLDTNQTLNAGNINSQEFIYQGDLLLSTKSINTLSFYDSSKDDSTSKVSDTVIEKLTVEPCSKVGAGSEVSLSIMENRSFRLLAKSADACVKIPLNKVIKVEDLREYKSLVNLFFTTSSKTNTLGHYCLFDNILGRCIKEQKYLPLLGSINDYFTVNADSLDNLELVFYTDGAQAKVSEIIYSMLTLSVKNYSDLITIFPEEIRDSFASQTNINSDISYSQNINIIEKGHEANSCSNILPRKFSRIIDSGQKIVEYSSEGGSSCDYYSLPNLSHNVGYLLNIESQNVSGLPLRVCLANPESRRCDLYISLPANKQFKKQTILIPPIADGGAGYNLHFDNYSTGRIISTNRIKRLEIRPFPYYWLSGIYQPADIKPQINPAKINYVRQFLPGFIQVSLDNPGENFGLLVLNRSFEEGWLMKDGEHVKVNGWANGWLIKPNQAGTVYIFYWPQVLEWGGFILLIATFGFLIFKKSLDIQNKKLT